MKGGRTKNPAIAVTNENETQIDHDAMFKELLHHLMEFFLKLFFPEEASRLDFSSLIFLEQEQFTDFPGGKHRYIDTLVEIKTLCGPETILVHVEFQSKRERDFPLRMFRYFSQLRLRRDTPIWPIVLYMPKGSGGLGFEEYTETLFDEKFLPFRYWCIGLPELNAEEYLATKNPVAYGLAPLMNHGSFSKPRLKAICLSGIAQSNINEVQAVLLAFFVDTYLPLNEAGEEEFQKLIQQEEVIAMQFITSWERQGIIKGRAEGALMALRETLLLQLQEKFGEVPSTAVQQVEAISSKKELEQLFRKFVHANSFAEMGLDGTKK